MGPKSQDHFHCRGSRPKLRGLHLLNALNFGGSILAVLLILTGRSLGGLLVVSCSRGSLLVAVHGSHEHRGRHGRYGRYGVVSRFAA